MHTRLKTLTTLAVICGTFAVTAPVQAKDNGNGTDRRCAAASNGNHYGFTCEDATDDVNGRCARGYEPVMVTLMPEVDLNDNKQICVRS
jgi:hypothetical protein